MAWDQIKVSQNCPFTTTCEIQNNYQHLRDILLNNYDTKSELPIRMILGISDYTKIGFGLLGEPITELTKLG